MMKDFNESIDCTVSECRFHSSEAMFCTLDQIKVVRHSPDAMTKDGTDCGSFEHA